MSTELIALIDKSFKEIREGSIVIGRIIEIQPQVVLVDIGYKSEGAIPISEFEDEDIEVGNDIEVLLERLENDEGMVVLSKEKAAHKQNWDKIVKVFHDGGLVKGKVKAVVKGGLMVNVGVEAFLPGSQIDIIPPKDLTEYVGNIYEFKIVKINDERKNVVLSRREVIEAERTEQRQAFLKDVNVGDAVDGIVKNITDFGAFVDLQGMDGLLHITDMSWGRVNHPSEMLTIAQTIKVQILEVDKEKERVSLGLKQLTPNPWEDIETRFPVGDHVKGKITKLVPYGAFVEVAEGVEGLIHVSELSWTKRITRPSDVLELGQDVEAVVLGINIEEQKISLGVRQLEALRRRRQVHLQPKAEREEQHGAAHGELTLRFGIGRHQRPLRAGVPPGARLQALRLVPFVRDAAVPRQGLDVHVYEDVYVYGYDYVYYEYGYVDYADDAVFGDRIPQLRARVVVRRHRHVERRSLSFPAHDGHDTRVAALVRRRVRLSLVIRIAHVDGRGHRGPLGALRIS